MPSNSGSDDGPVSLGDEKGSWPIVEHVPAAETELFLLFAAGKRPNPAALKKFAQSQRTVSLTHNPYDDGLLQLVTPDHAEAKRPEMRSADPDLAERLWVEVMREGLTFDLTGLAPGPDCAFPAVESRFDLDNQPTGFRFEGLKLTPGQHLTGGQRSLPVVKGLIALARDLTHHFDGLEAIVWPASQSAIGRRFFESVVTAWLEGGPFPALGLTAFRETSDGALQSVGLDFWIGQELRLEAPIASDKIAATRLGVRIINQMVLSGTLRQSDRVVAPDGRVLTLHPSANGKFIRVWQD